MGEIIYLSERIKRINNTKEELEAQRKKALNKKTTFHFSYYELAVLILELCERLAFYDELVNDISEYDDWDSIDDYSRRALHISRLVKKLYKLYLDNDCFLDSKIQFTLADLELCMETLEITCDVYSSLYRKEDGTLTIKDNYQKLDRYHRTAFYLYTIITGTRKSILEKATTIWKQTLSKQNLKKYEELEKEVSSARMNMMEETIDKVYELYKNHYIDEYKSKVQFIYESTSWIDNEPIWISYFVNGGSKFNKFMTKYYYHKESKNFEYYFEDILQHFKEESSEDMHYFPIGWRFSMRIPTESQYEEEVFDSELYDEWLEYEDYISLKAQEVIKTSEEMQKFDFEIIDKETQEDIRSDYYRLNEVLLDNFEDIIDIYCGADNIIHQDGRIGHEFGKIIELCYQ